MRDGLLLNPPRKRNYPNSQPGIYGWSDLGAAGLWGLQHKRQKLKAYQIRTEGMSIEEDSSPGLYSGSSAWRILADVPPSAITYLGPEEWLKLLRENDAIL